MADLVVIVPSRGRPEAARALIRAFADTCTADTELTFAVDDNDPTREEYGAAVTEARSRTSVGYVEQPCSMVYALNEGAREFAETVTPTPFAIGFMGDDHCPRTHGWDRAYLDAMKKLGTGMVYGNDLFQGERLPTQIAMTSDIIRALGYMAPPELTHLYVDNFWLDLGRAAGCIRYLPEVIVEHRHPLAGKAAWDDGYARVNDGAMYVRDEAAYASYRSSRFDGDVAKVKALRGAA